MHALDEQHLQILSQVYVVFGLVNDLASIVKEKVHIAKTMQLHELARLLHLGPLQICSLRTVGASTRHRRR
jgi:hypothetical protein